MKTPQDFLENKLVFKTYRRPGVRRVRKCEMADWRPGTDMSLVSISTADKKNGSPKLGDKIARNEFDHEDMWLVSKEYFEKNYEIDEN